MCIIDGPVKHVSNTKILVAPVYQARIVKKTNDDEGSKLYKQPFGRPMQLTIYSNQVDRDDSMLDNEMGVMVRPVAMILPFPLIKGKNRVKLLDLSRYKNIFEDLELLFPDASEFEYTNSTRSNSYSFDAKEQKLEVYYVGSYKASIVPRFEAFDQLQYKEFNLSPDVKELLRSYYAKGFGFVVCIMSKSGSGSQYHPFAYVHEIREDGRLFVPTRHYHRKPTLNPYAKYFDPEDGQKLRHAEMARGKFYRPGHDDLDGLGLPAQMRASGYTRSSMDNPLNPNALDLDQDDPESRVGNLELQDYFYKTLNVEDRWIQLSAKKNNLAGYRSSGEAREGPDWDHDIYVFNVNDIMKKVTLQKPGIRVIAPDASRLGNMYVYLDSQKMPSEIALGVVKHLYKIHISGTYRANHDFLL